MALLYLFERLLIEHIARHGHLAGPDEFVGDAAQGTDHDNDRLALPLNNLLYTQYAFCGTHGSSAKFQYFHPCLLTIRVQRYEIIHN